MNETDSQANYRFVAHSPTYCSFSARHSLPFAHMLLNMKTSDSKLASIREHAVQNLKVAPFSVAAMTSFSIAPGIGASTVALEAKVNGKTYAVFPARDLNSVDEKMKRDANYPFKQFNTPLFPMSNRLLPSPSTSNLALKLGQDLSAQIEGIEVKMPLNHQASQEDAIPHHLHGLVYDQAAQKVEVISDRDSIKAVSEFDQFLRNYWTGQAKLRIEQSIEKGIFHYRMRAQNTGTQAMPVGFGSHPYFQIPSGNPSSFQMRIPAQELADIDNLQNVLPKGTFSSVTLNEGRLDFSKLRSLPSGVIDNYFVLDPNQKREVELVDVEANVRYRFTANTPNILGVQVFYPGEGSVIAVEFVTHHPDPRAELWKHRPTGMQVLKPGESAEYAYQISVEPR